MWEKRTPDLIVQGIFDYLHNQIEIAFKVFNNLKLLEDITKILSKVMNTVMSMTDE